MSNTVRLLFGAIVGGILGLCVAYTIVAIVVLFAKGFAA
jgi:gas vesicle protein